MRQAEQMIVRERKCRKCGAAKGQKCRDKRRQWDEAVHNVRRPK